jgi:hypothetical protein|tara:strand:+ start:515 stop:649 length:135 start_codon:yes stop_codon:yes gene_type:complete
VPQINIEVPSAVPLVLNRHPVPEEEEYVRKYNHPSKIVNDLGFV